MPTCVCVNGTPASWQTALHALVHPEQVVSVLPARGTPLDRATEVLATILYRPDAPTCDQWCAPGPPSDPAATLASHRGDCDDMVILGLSCLAATGLWAVMAVGIYGTGTTPNHVWIEGEDAEGWFLFETTNGEVHRATRPDGYLPLHLLDPRNTEPLQVALAGPPDASRWTGALILGAAALATVGLVVAASAPSRA